MSGAPKKDGAFIYVNGKVGRKREIRKKNATLLKSDGGIAQLARAPALHAGGQRFESVILHSAFYRQTFFDMMYTKSKVITS